MKRPKPSAPPDPNTKLSDLSIGAHSVHIFQDTQGTKQFSVEPAHVIGKVVTDNIYVAFVLDIFYGALAAVFALLMLRLGSLALEKIDIWIPLLADSESYKQSKNLTSSLSDYSVPASFGLFIIRGLLRLVVETLSELVVIAQMATSESSNDTKGTRKARR